MQGATWDGTGPQQAGGLRSPSRGFGPGAVSQAAVRISGGDQQPGCGRGKCPPPNAGSPHGALCFLLGHLPWVGAVVVCSALGRAAYGPVRGSSSTHCPHLLLTPRQGPSGTISSLPAAGGTAAAWGELLPYAPRARFLQAPGAQGNEQQHGSHIPPPPPSRRRPREGAAQRASHDARRGLGRREGCLPAGTLPPALGYCAASFLLPEGCKGAGLYRGTASDQVIQATAASCLAWDIARRAGGKEINKTLCRRAALARNSV